MPKRRCLIYLVWLIAVLVSFRRMGAQESAASQSEVADFVDRLGGLPAEYKADLGFAVIRRSPKMPRARKEQILDQIFLSAPHAHYPAFIIYAGQKSSSNASQLAHNLTVERLDALDIQTRVVSLALAIDPTFAEKEFAKITLSYPRATCADPLVYDPDVYFTTLEQVSSSGQSRAESARDNFTLLQKVISETGDPERLASVIKLIQAVKLTDSDFRSVITSLTERLEGIISSDREMQALYPRVAEAVGALAVRIRANGMPNSSLLKAYRSFLINGLGKESCHDSTTDRVSVVESFNQLILSNSHNDAGAPLPLTGEDLRARESGPDAVDPSTPVDPSVMPPQQRLSAGRRARMIAESKGESIPDDGADPADVDVVLTKAISREKLTTDCELCDYEMHAFEFFMLGNSLPSGQQLKKTMSGEIDFLSFNVVEEHDPPAYLLLLKELINISRPVSEKTRADLHQLVSSTKSFQGAPSEDSAQIRQALHRSQDRIMKTYVDFEDVFSPEYEIPKALAERLQKR